MNPDDEKIRLQIDEKLRAQIDGLSNRLNQSVQNMPIRRDIQRPSVEIQTETQTLKTGEESRVSSKGGGLGDGNFGGAVPLWVSYNGALAKFNFQASFIELSS